MTASPHEGVATAMTSRTIAITGGRVLCPATSLVGPADILIEGGRVTRIAPPSELAREASALDASGCIVAPGLVDVHVHLREPGSEHKETISSGTRAALMGGFTTVMAMPNTDPAPDSPENVRTIRALMDAGAGCHTQIIGAATVNNDCERLTDFAALKAAGCIAISDDAFMLRTREQRREALRQCAAAGLVFIAHLEDPELSGDGVMREGEVSRRLGVPGQRPEAEVRCLEAWREAWDDDAAPPLHLAHVSTAATCEALRDWPAGPTAETAPHYLTLTDEAVVERGANAKMNPPLKTEADRAALVQALRDGTITCIATDHAPHTSAEKSAGLSDAPFGIVGLETALGVVWEKLVHGGALPERSVLAALTAGPAAVFDMNAGRIALGGQADIVIFDPDAAWTVAPEAFESLGRNTPFAGESLRGRVRDVIVGGRIAVRDGALVSRTVA